jgi:hypothetical protein
MSFGLWLGACGGRAEVGSIAAEAAPPFQECSTTCDNGLTCLEGLCTRPCDADGECTDLSSRAECTAFSTRRNAPTVCTIPCSSDDGCQALGAGSFCNRIYCVAGDLEALPDSFESLELRRIGGGSPGAVGACDPSEFETSITVSIRLGLIIWSRCQWDEPSGSYGLNSASGALDDLTLSAVRSAYAGLELSDELQCTPGAELLTLDVEARGGPALLFADEEHSGCPVARLGRGSYVSGLAALYAQLARLDGAID